MLVGLHIGYSQILVHSLCCFNGLLCGCGLYSYGVELMVLRGGCVVFRRFWFCGFSSVLGLGGYVGILFIAVFNMYRLCRGGNYL